MLEELCVYSLMQKETSWLRVHQVLFLFLALRSVVDLFFAVQFLTVILNDFVYGPKIIVI